MSTRYCARYTCVVSNCERLMPGMPDSEHYLCEECYAELVAWKSTWQLPMLSRDVQFKILEFIPTEPGSMKILYTKEEIDNEFKRLFDE